MRKKNKPFPRSLSECFCVNSFQMERNLHDYIAFELRYLRDYSVALTPSSIAQRFNAIGCAYNTIATLIRRRHEC